MSTSSRLHAEHLRRLRVLLVMCVVLVTLIVGAVLLDAWTVTEIVRWGGVTVLLVIATLYLWGLTVWDEYGDSRMGVVHRRSVYVLAGALVVWNVATIIA